MQSLPAILIWMSMIGAVCNGYVADPFACKTCHEKQYSFWENTKHASAYMALYAKNDHFNPSCVKCHTLGFEEAGGFSKITEPLQWGHAGKKTPAVEVLMKFVFEGDKGGPLFSADEPERFSKLQKRYHEKLSAMHAEGEIGKIFLGVQCEKCHGLRVEHVKTHVRGKPVSLETCKGCHRPPNVMKFDPKRLPEVSCPLISSEKH